MSEGNIIPGVRSLRQTVNNITYFGSATGDTYKLIARSILKGSCDFNQNASRYKRGGVAACREEGVFVEYALRQTLNRMPETTPRVLQEEVLPDAVLEQIVRKMPSGRSMVLSNISHFLRQSDDYYQGLIIFGAEVDKALNHSNFHRSIDPLDVDLNRLDGYRIPVQIKTVFREFRQIEDVARNLYQGSLH